MNIPNHITLNDLRGMQVGAIAALSGGELAPLRQEADEQLRAAKALCDWLDGAIALKYGDRAHAVRSADSKDTGTIRFADGAVTVVAELPKRVDWDQAKLAILVERIRADGEDPSYRRIIDRVREANPDARIFGVTATPNRGDKKGLREVFDNVADQVSLGELRGAGFDLYTRKGNRPDGGQFGFSVAGGRIRGHVDTRWQLVTNDGTGAPTLTDMGASFGITTGGVLTLFIAAPPNGSSVWVRVVDEVSGAVFEQEITADLPANTQFLSPRLFMNNGATAAAVAYDCSGVYVETDY